MPEIYCDMASDNTVMESLTLRTSKVVSFHLSENYKERRPLIFRIISEKTATEQR